MGNAVNSYRPPEKEPMTEPQQPFTILDEGHPAGVKATLADGAVWLGPEAIRSALGWEIKPEGLCREEICIPLPADPGLADGKGLELRALARLLGRPLALDAAAGAACLGTPAEQRAERLASLQAPDFTLPDLAGQGHTLSDFRGKKVLLVAYASW